MENTEFAVPRQPGQTVLALADAIDGTAEGLSATARMLLDGLAPNVSPERLLLLAGPLLAKLAEVEREACRLQAFSVAPRRAP